ncbi:MAG: DNA polymerase III subunit gamma/tau [Candidatus Magasanikbacteria bacterium]|nr:DNA polymerase III subunit gamma/tau [Candidatus Magasanikbacteria bacterium]
MSSLYRKHRPQSWSEMIGQDHVRHALTQEIMSNRVNHAYLFSGSRGLGKTTTARLLAKAVNCAGRVDGAYEPCNECVSCVAITKGCDLDVIEIDAASQSGVDNVRETIIDNSRQLPTRSAKKIFIIDEVHMLSNAAFNALLKTLEEPPSHVLFILATTELHKLPETILSRCERFTFDRARPETIKARLTDIATKEGVAIAPTVLERLARAGNGSFRDAESILGQLLSAGDGSVITDEAATMILPPNITADVARWLERALSGDASVALAVLTALTERGIDAKIIAMEAIELTRLAVKIRAKAGASNELGNETAAVLETLSALSAKILVATMDILFKRRSEIGNAPIAILPLEMATLELTELTAAGADGPDGRRYVTDRGDSVSLAERRDIPSPLDPSAQAPAKQNLNEIIESLRTKPADVVAPSSAVENNDTNVSLDEVKNRWNECIAEVEKINNSLPIILGAMQPRNVENGMLTLETRFPFHREKVTELKNRSLIEDVLRRLCGGRVSIRCELTPIVAPITVDNSEPIVNTLLETFGGRVIE